jgi:hypothetical protein
MANFLFNMISLANPKAAKMVKFMFEDSAPVKAITKPEPEVIDNSEPFNLQFRCITIDNYKIHLAAGQMIMFGAKASSGNYGVIRANGEDIDNATVAGLRLYNIIRNYPVVFQIMPC